MTRFARTTEEESEFSPQSTTTSNALEGDEISTREEDAYTEDNSVEEDEYQEEDDDTSTTGKSKKKRKSHVETKHRKTFMSIDVPAMRSCLHLNQKDAAKKLNVSLSTLKRR